MAVFFIHAQHRRVPGRIQILPDDIGGLALTTRIVARHIMF